MAPRPSWITAALVLLASVGAWAQTAAPSARPPHPAGAGGASGATALLAVPSPESWVKRLIPDSIQDVSLGGMMLWQWIGLGVGLILGWILATLIASTVAAGLDRLAQRTVTTWDDVLLKTARRPVRLLLWVVFFQLACSQLDLPKAAEGAAGHLAYTGYVIGSAWLLLGFINTGTLVYEGALADDTLGELKSRALRTRLTVARSITSVLLLVASGAILLMQFEVVRNLGLSLLASAGVGVAVLGFAAQKSLAGVVAGIQLSISQPVRIGDLIQFENELGNIEEINLTYVVIKLWDERRLVVPISKFVEANVQNWSRGHLELLGTVFVHADPTLPVPLLRAELERLCAAHKLWDKRKALLAVTDMSPDSITLRALVSVSHPDHFFDLRNDIREGLIAYLRELEGGAYLPRRRWAPALPPVTPTPPTPPTPDPRDTEREVTLDPPRLPAGACGGDALPRPWRVMRSRGLLLALLLAGCVEQAPPLDYGDPTALREPTEVDGITGYIVAPRAGAAIPGSTLTVEVAAYTRAPAEPLRVRIGPKNGGLLVAEADGEPGPGQRFRAPVALLHGVNVVQVLVESEDGKRFRRLDFEALYDGKAPGLSFSLLAAPPGGAGCGGALPLDGAPTAAKEACVRGRVTTAAGATPAAVRVEGAAPVDAALDAGGFFEAVVPLASDAKQTLRITATDSRKRSVQGEATVEQDSKPPALALTSPGAGPALQTDEDQILLGGTASDAGGLASLRIESSKGSVQAIAPASPWQTSVLLEPGLNQLTVVAVDRAGNSTSLPLQVDRTRVIRLNAPQGGQASAKLSLDRAALASLLSEEDQKKIKAATVPLRPAIVASLQAIREPEKYGVNAALWGQAEKNLSRLLGMSPDNADLKGTSIEELLGLAAAVGLPPARLLSDLLGIEVTDPFLPIDALADVMLANSVATHPNATLDAQGQPVLEISLHDVFQDLKTLGPRFGPAGDHPGFLDGPTEAKVLESGFLMGLPVKTNLRQYDGVDASATSKASLFLLEGDSVLELDFTSGQFSIVGLADEPSVDLRVRVREAQGFFPAGKSKEVNPDPKAPGFFLGDGPAWGLKPWFIERLVTDAAYRRYAPSYGSSGYKKALSYDAGSIKEAAKLSWDRGWVSIATSGGIGAPPPPQYIWDMILEVAQVRLHDGVAEGAADVAFDLKKIPVGLTADELIAQLKPTLQAQAPELSKLLAGSAGLASSPVDFFYVPSPQGGYLFFRAPEDGGGAYKYATPGFFEDAKLTKKVSSKGPAAGTADAAHEKVAAKAGLAVYLADDGGEVFSLEVLAADPQGVSVRVRRAGGGS